MTFLSVMFSFDLYPKVMTLLMILPPVWNGEQLLPERIFPLLPLVFSFVDAVVHKTVLFNTVLLSEGWVMLVRLEV